MIVLLAATLLVRGGMLVFAFGSLEADPDAYRILAENLLLHGTFGGEDLPTAYRPPLYPLVLTGCICFGQYANLAIAALHLVLGLATVSLVYHLGRRWGLGGYALPAAMLTACDPLLLIQSTLVMTETLAALLVVVTLVCLSSFHAASSHAGSAGTSPPASIRWAIVSGVCLGLATLCRATFLSWLVVVALVIPLFADSWLKRLKLTTAFLAAASVVLAPWVIRNQIQFGRPVVATTHGGYTLLLGNNPWFYEYLRSGDWGTIWDAEEFHQTWESQVSHGTTADEIRNDRLAYDEAQETIRSQPGTFFYSCLVRAGRFWGVLPHQLSPDESDTKRWARYLVGIWYLAVTSLAAAGLVYIFRRQGGTPWWQSEWIWGLLLAFCFTAVHAVYWSNMRMRAPLMPLIALVAALGAAWISSGLRRRPRDIKRV